MNQREPAARRPAVTEHVVQLFDTPDSLANVVSAFLYEGWLRGCALLVAAKPGHWLKTSERLERRGCPVAQAIRDGRLEVLDAATTLARITRGTKVDPQLFLDCVGPTLRRLAEHGRSVRIYGEIVELLAEEGDLRGAGHLEELWNDLGTQQPFTLLCGYTAAHFANSQSMPALHAICGAHTRVQKNTSDLLGNWLIAQHLTQAD